MDDDDWSNTTGNDTNASAGNGDDWGSADPEADDSWNDESPDKTEPSLQLSRQVSYVIIESKTIKDRQKAMLQGIIEDLFLNEQDAGCFLRFYRYNASKLKNEWFELGADKVKKKAGIRARPPLPANPSRQVQCLMAFCDMVDRDKAFALPCGHYYCNDCWTQYLTNAVQSGRGCVFVLCPGFICEKKSCQHSVKKGCKCEEMIPEDIVERYVKDPELIKKYRQWLLELFVEGNKTTKFCPKPGCDRVVEYKKGGNREIHCKCGHEFCFSCGRVPHVPAPCDLVQRFLEQGDTDKATQDLLAATTKKCPKCSVPITKDRACNHMNCANCKHHFCWLCKGDWKDHGSQTGGYYVCKAYNESKQTGKYSEEEKQMMEKTKLMQKYLFFRQHHEHHKQAAKYAQKSLEGVSSADKFKIVAEAWNRVIQCRKVLQWTYCLAYFLKQSSGKNLFEMQQQMLNNFTEELQELLEAHDKDKSHDQLLSNEVRQKVINKTKSIAEYAENTIKSIDDGDLTSLLMYEADIFTSGWTCTACSHTHEEKLITKDSKDSDKSKSKPGATTTATTSATTAATSTTASTTTTTTTDKKKDKKKEDKATLIGADYCEKCGACRKHGEMDCKACKPKDRDHW